MTQRQLEKRITYWKRKLSLHSWEFHVSVHETPMGHESANAAVRTEEHSETAHIVFKEGWEEWTQEEADRIIVHELLHVRRRDYYRAQHVVCDHLSPAVADLVHDELTHEDEKDIDWLARLIVELDAE